MVDLETIKCVLRSHLISSARSMTAHHLASDFRNSEGYECPYSALGYRSFIEFLESIPDTVKLLGNGLVKAVCTKETEHISKLVALQKKSQPRRRLPCSRRTSSFGYGSSRPSYRPAPSYHCPPSTCQPAQSHSSQYRYPQASIKENFGNVRKVNDEVRRETFGTSAPSRAQVSHSPPGWSGDAFIRDWQKQHTHGGGYQIERVLVPEIISSDDSDDGLYDRFHDNENVGKGESPEGINNSAKPSKLDTFLKSSDTINDQLKENLKNLIKSYPKGIWACVLPEKYQEKFGVSLNWSELGYDSVVQMAHDLLDVFFVKRVRSGDWMLFDASFPLPAEIQLTQESGRGTPTVPVTVKGKIYNIVKKYSSGIRAEQLVQLYEENYGKSLRVEAPGFDGPEALLLSIQDTVIHVRFIRKECYIYPGQPLPQPQMPVLAVDTNTKKELGLYPEEVWKPGDSPFPPPDLPSTVQPGDYIELQVGEVYNPHKFWIMLREYSLQLKILMDELQDFYHDHGNKYLMPDATLSVGQCCIALYEGEWHRATIKSVVDTVEVFYVDYGTVTNVSRDRLRFIHRDFCTLPAQAIRASMCGIQPPNGLQRFTIEANRALLNLVSDRYLIGLVQKIDPKEPFLKLFLIDTNGETDIHLNDVLVEEEHAVYELDAEPTQALEDADTEHEKEPLAESTLTLPVSVPVSTTLRASISLGSNENTHINQNTVGHCPINQVNQATSFNVNRVSSQYSAAQVNQNIPAFCTANQVNQNVPAAYSANHVNQNVPAAYSANQVNQTIHAAYSANQANLTSSWNVAQPSHNPPPGFAASAAVTVPPSVGTVGFGAFSPSPAFYPMMNPALAAYSAALLPQINAAMLLQQHMQQQHALLLAHYQKMNQQSAASLLTNQPNTAIQTTIPGAYVNQPWTGPSVTQTALSSEYLDTSAIQNKASKEEAFSTEGKNLNRMNRSSNETPYVTDAKDTSTANASVVEAESGPEETICSRTSTSSVQSDTSEDQVIARRKVTKKKRSNNRPSPCSSERESQSKAHSSFTCFSPTIPAGNEKTSKDLSVFPKTFVQRLSGALSMESVTSESPDDDEYLIEPMNPSVTCEPVSSTPLCHNIAPDIVQSVASLNLSSSHQNSQVSGWKIGAIGGQHLYLFNIDSKVYVSTGELARKFTSFSTCDTLVRVLKNKDICTPCKKLTRQERLSLFSHLDSFSEEVVQKFDLCRNKSGSVVGTFHLTPLANVPSMLIPLGIDITLVKDFQKLRDSFTFSDPNFMIK